MQFYGPLYQEIELDGLEWQNTDMQKDTNYYNFQR